MSETFPIYHPTLHDKIVRYVKRVPKPDLRVRYCKCGQRMTDDGRVFRCECGRVRFS